MDRIFVLDEIAIKPGHTECGEASWRHSPLKDIDELLATFYYLWPINVTIERTACGER